MLYTSPEQRKWKSYDQYQSPVRRRLDQPYQCHVRIISTHPTCTNTMRYLLPMEALNLHNTSLHYSAPAPFLQPPYHYPNTANTLHLPLPAQSSHACSSKPHISATKEHV